jgi:hypothetical protein
MARELHPAKRLNRSALLSFLPFIYFLTLFTARTVLRPAPGLNDAHSNYIPQFLSEVSR